MELNPYAKSLGDQDPIPVITATVERLHALIDPLSPAQADRNPEPDKWSIRESIAHLADCEMVFAFRLRQTLAEGHHIIQPFDQSIWAKRYASYDLKSAFDLFAAARNWNLKFLTTVTEDDRHHPTTHPERGTMILWTIVETIAGHDLHHLQQIEHLAQVV
ncbi:DinB family protein [Edaphobacter modestus]|uniref:Putative damage-inducible protein DinB n=1 Tax=Edaphobacter modestus TaxID=388466 RepID=A0A4Q7YTD1_9BACT|nr:DinB family protein [Edaphobacter modestus]RZU41062.1 putative damage-inducible protein DinB [Edaphobacter modestus]